MKRRKTLNKYLTKPVESDKEVSNKNKGLLAGVFSLVGVVNALSEGYEYKEDIDYDKMAKSQNR